ncbi:site-2 protease family protein [Caldiplasma sukawensis]
MNDLEIVILVLFLWVIILVSLRPRINKSKHFQTYFGILLLVKITKNRGILDKVAGNKNKKYFAKLSVPIVYFLLISAIAILLYSAILSFSVKESIPLNEYIALPGINPDIPIIYGLIAFSLSVIIHEMFHGIVARKHNIDVNSVGVMFLVVPIGAFVEPKQDQIEKADPVARRRVVGAGIAVNFVIGVICFLLLSLAMSHLAVQKEPGSYLDGVCEGTPMFKAESYPSELVKFGNYSGNNIYDIAYNSNIMPGKTVNVTLYNGKTFIQSQTLSGVFVVSTIEGYGAYGNITNRSYLISIDKTIIYNESQLSQYLNSINPGTNITVEFATINMSSQGYGRLNYHNTTFITGSVYSYYEKYDPSAATPQMKHESFIGVETIYAGLELVPMNYFKNIIFGDIVYSTNVRNDLAIFGLPLEGLSPVPSAFAHLYSVPLGYNVFWFTANLLYWFFWVNILLALTNAFPAIIFDGAQFFRDTLLIASKKERFKYLRDERNVANITSLVSTLIIFLILLTLILPRIV